jgi:hypothetical protein
VAREDAIQVDSFTLEEYGRAAAWQKATEPPAPAPAETVPA